MALGEIFVFWGAGGRKPCGSKGACPVKLTLDNLDQRHVEKRQSSRTAIAMKTCKRTEAKLGISRGLSTDDIFEVTPFITSESTFCKVGYKVFYSLIFMLRKKNLSSYVFSSSFAD